MNEFIEIGNYTVRVSEITLIGYRIERDRHSIKDWNNCYVDVLLGDGAKLIIDIGYKKKIDFDEIKEAINSKLMNKFEPSEVEPRKHKTITTITRRRN
ncbi:MAG: hypothetical protein HC836_46215 [Richelia sp. RM2_1_2]|nr:hypothetical protein [Richelia sp. RM2_1_2]